MRDAFAHRQDLTVAAEDELLLLDPATFDLTPAAPELFVSLADSERYREEISPAQLEIVSGVCSTSADVRAQLADGRRNARWRAGAGVRFAGVGAHPFAVPWSAVGSAARYQALLTEHQLGIRLGALAAGLHVHVAVAGADRSLAVHNALRSLMPALVALSANAPFIAGVDSGLATVRCSLADALPRHGTGPAFRDWGTFEASLEWGRVSGAVPDTSRYWWDCRLNTRTGTVEVRALDAQASLDDAEALIALVHSAVADLCRRYDAGERLPVHDTLAIEENRWRAARWGLEGELVDLETARLTPARRLIGDLLARLGGAAAVRGAERGLELAHQMLERDTPGEHRRIAAADGLSRLCERLAAVTESDS